MKTYILRYDSIAESIWDGKHTTTVGGALINRLLTGIRCRETLRQEVHDGLLGVYRFMGDYVCDCLRLVRSDELRKVPMERYFSRLKGHLEGLDQAASDMEESFRSVLHDADEYCVVGEPEVRKEDSAVVESFQTKLGDALVSSPDDLREETVGNLGDILGDSLEIHGLVHLCEDESSTTPVEFYHSLFEVMMTLYSHTIPNHIRDMDEETPGALSNLDDICRENRQG